MTRTRDGARTFDVLREGLPRHPAYDLVLRHTLAIADDGDQRAFGCRRSMPYGSPAPGRPPRIR